MKNFYKRSPIVVNPIYNHPAERRLDLKGEWNFRLDPDDRGISEKWYKYSIGMPEKINVPGCWQGQGFGTSEDDFVKDAQYDVRVFKATYKGTAWYSKVFRIPTEWKGEGDPMSRTTRWKS